MELKWGVVELTERQKGTVVMKVADDLKDEYQRRALNQLAALINVAPDDITYEMLEEISKQEDAASSRFSQAASYKTPEQAIEELDQVLASPEAA